MGEFNLPRVEFHHRICDRERLAMSPLLVHQVAGITHDRKSHFPQMNADLIGASGQRTSFNQAGTIRPALDDTDLGLAGGSHLKTYVVEATCTGPGVNG